MLRKPPHRLFCLRRRRARLAARWRTPQATAAARSTVSIIPWRGWRQPRKPSESCLFPSRSRRAPKTFSTARPIWTIPSVACRPTSRPERTCFMRPPCRLWRRSAKCARRYETGQRAGGRASLLHGQGACRGRREADQRGIGLQPGSAQRFSPRSPRNQRLRNRDIRGGLHSIRRNSVLDAAAGSLARQVACKRCNPR